MMSAGVQVAPLFLYIVKGVERPVYGVSPKTEPDDLNYKIKVQVQEKFRMKKVLAIALLAFALSACKTTNSNIGAAVGGIAGGLLGATVGKGNGQLLSTGAGALIGTVVGSKVGENMDAPKN